YIEEQMVEREGTYPDRHIYRITELGHTYLIDLLRETFDDVAGRRRYDPLDAAFSFAFLLPQEEVLAYLHHQLDSASGLLIRLLVTQRLHRRVLEQTTSQIRSRARSESLYAQLMIDHNAALLQHEVQWLQEAIHRLAENPDFTPGWQHDQAADASEASDQAIITAYQSFDNQLAGMAPVAARYHQEMERAWQEYKRVTEAGASVQEARRAYQQRMSAIRQALEDAIGEAGP